MLQITAAAAAATAVVVSVYVTLATVAETAAECVRRT